MVYMSGVNSNNLSNRKRSWKEHSFRKCAQKIMINMWKSMKIKLFIENEVFIFVLIKEKLLDI
jgi:hypothetical protein